MALPVAAGADGEHEQGAGCELRRAGVALAGAEPVPIPFGFWFRRSSEFVSPVTTDVPERRTPSKSNVIGPGESQSGMTP